ncbi:MAG: hypothetical protein CMJ58_03595 [Planctomycetaceae bacterium]|nr:hypothetical protein [Planctomycetaceae bacterium]
MLNCPSRRSNAALPAVEMAFNADLPDVDAKTDYAASGGTHSFSTGPGPGPNCLTDFPNCNWTNADTTLDGGIDPGSGFDGIVTDHRGAKLRQVTDGTANTIMAGEKWLPPRYYEDVIAPGDPPTGAKNPGDNNSLWEGYDYDNVRWPNQSNLPSKDTDVDPQFPTTTYWQLRMGSAHSSGMNVVHVDGSVHTVEYDIDPQTWDNLSKRNDGNVSTD